MRPIAIVDFCLRSCVLPQLTFRMLDRANLSLEADPADRAVPGRRRHRSNRARTWRAFTLGLGTARHCGIPGRGRRHHRFGFCREVSAGWLHFADVFGRPDHDRPGFVFEPALCARKDFDAVALIGGRAARASGQ